MAVPALPPFVVQLGLASNPLDYPQTWTDVTKYVKDVQIQRGRQHVLGQFDPGRLTLLCDGRDGQLDPTLSTGLWLSSSKPTIINKQVQVAVKFQLLPQNAARTTSASTDGWPNKTNCTQAFTNSNSYGGGKIALTAQAAGNASTSTAAGTAGFLVRSGFRYVASVNVATAASTTGRTITLNALTYNSAGSLLTTNASSAVEAGAASSITINMPFTADATAAYGALQVQILSAASAEVHNITNPSWLCVPSLPASTNNFYDGNPFPIYTGFVDSVAPDWQDNLNTDITITATDTLRMLQNLTMAPDGGYLYAKTDLADDFWACNDAVGAAAAADLIGSSPATAFGPGIIFGVAPRNSSTAFTTMTAPAAGAAYVRATTSPASGDHAWSYDGWFKSSGDAFILRTLYSSSVVDLQVILTSGQVQVSSNVDGAVSVNSVATTYNDNAWHYFSVAYDHTNTLIWLQVDATTVSQNHAYSLHASQNTTIIGGGGAAGSVMGFSDVGLYKTIFLSATQRTNHYNAGLAGGGGFPATDYSGTRIKNVLDSASLTSAYETVPGTSPDDTGQSQIQSAIPSGANALSYGQSVALAETGYLFCDRNGKINFYDRHHFMPPVSLATFGDGSGEIPYKQSPQFAVDNIDFYNGAQITRTGGNVQTVTPSTASIATYGAQRSLIESGLLIESDAEAYARAQFRVGQFGTPLSRVAGATIDLASNPSALYYFIGSGGTGSTSNSSYQSVGLCSVVTLKRRPYTKAGGFPAAQFSQVALVEGMDHHITQSTWETTLRLAPADTQNYWVLGTSALDSTTVLSY